MKKVRNIEHVWSVVCVGSSIDRDSNNITLFNTLERITANIPSQVLNQENSKRGAIQIGLNFEVVSRFWKREQKKAEVFDFRLRVVSPSGKTVSTFEQPRIALKEGIINFRLRNRFPTLPIDGNGTYWIVVEIKDLSEQNYEEMQRLPIEIIINSVDEPLPNENVQK